jgi:hypothetical protein
MAGVRGAREILRSQLRCLASYKRAADLMYLFISSWLPRFTRRRGRRHDEDKWRSRFSFPPSIGDIFIRVLGCPQYRATRIQQLVAQVIIVGGLSRELELLILHRIASIDHYPVRRYLELFARIFLASSSFLSFFFSFFFFIGLAGNSVVGERAISSLSSAIVTISGTI